MKALLIPVKDPSNAKTRLARLFSADERRRLAWAMFEDVARAVADARQPDRVVLVSSFAPAIERAHGLGWDVLIERSQVSESASVDWASRVLSERGFDTVMRLPADLPLVRGEDIDGILSIRIDRPGAVLVPSRDGTGTNAILRSPATLFRSRFGPDSLALHKREAAGAGVECLVVSNERIALDIDEPEDLASLLVQGVGTKTCDTVAAFGNLEDRVLRKARKDSQRTQG